MVAPLSAHGRDAADAVVRSVERYVRSRCRSIGPRIGVDPDDLAAEANWKLAKAVASGWYDPSRLKPTTMADMCVMAAVHVVARKYHRRERAGFRVTAGETSEGLPLSELFTDAMATDPGDDAAFRELIDRLPSALSKLPEAERDALVDYYGLNGDQPVQDLAIGRRAGISRQAAQQRRCRGLAKLYTLLRTPQKG